MALKIIFAGTSAFAVPALESLIASEHQVVAVYTPPDKPAGRGLKLTPSPVKLIAEAHHLPIYQPATLRDLQTQQTLIDLCADLIVVAAYGLLLPKAVLEAPRYGCLNIHPSLLPRWRGAAPLPRAIEAGDLETGVSIMQLDEGLDTGDIWMQERYLLDSEETTQSLHDKLAPLSATLLLKTIDQVAAQTMRPTPQTDVGLIYAAKIDKSEAHLNWHEPAVVLARKIRAFNPWPVAYAMWKGAPLKIWQAQVLHSSDSHIQAESGLPGKIIRATAQGIDVMTGEGVLRLLAVQLPGGKCLSAADFVHGHAQFLKTACLC